MKWKIFEFCRQHIINETGDHFLVVEPTEKSMVKRLRIREQHKRTAHYMQGKGKYYGDIETVEPIIDLL